MVFNAIRQACHNYYDQLPDDIINSTCKSAVYSFTYSLLLRNLNKVPTTNFHQPLIAAGVASLASLIYALTNPIFTSIFGHHQKRVIPESVKFVITKALTQHIVNATGQKINLFFTSNEQPYFTIIGSSYLLGGLNSYAEIFMHIINRNNPFAFFENLPHIFFGREEEPQRHSNSIHVVI